MKVKDLEKIVDIEKEKEALLYQIAQAKAEAEKITKFLSPDKIQESKKNSSENKMVKYSDFVIKLQETEIELLYLKIKALDQIVEIKNPTYRTLLRLRYIANKKWDDIAEILGYQDSKWTRETLHKRALDAFEKV